MSFDGTGYFKGKLPPGSLLFVGGQRPSWEMPYRFLLGLFYDPGGYGIPEQYHNDLRHVQAAFFPSMITRTVDMLVEGWIALNNHQERKKMKFTLFQALPYFEQTKVGAGPAEVTAIYHLIVRFHDTYIQLFTAMDAIAYIFSIADPPEGIALTPEMFFLPLLDKFAKFLFFLNTNQDACPKVMCIVVQKSGNKVQWLLGASIGRFKLDDRYWDTELKSKLAKARWMEMSRLLGLNPMMVAPYAGSVGGHGWGTCAESLPFACILRGLDPKSETVWGLAVKWEDNQPIHLLGRPVALERVRAIRISPCQNCQRLLELKGVEGYPRFHSYQTSSSWLERYL